MFNVEESLYQTSCLFDRNLNLSLKSELVSQENKQRT